jgi:UDP:flavonoid glycosyltransferase YjiC (YdhE family)
LKSRSLAPFRSDLDIYTGDLNLMSDAPELFTQLEETDAYRFIGPILNSQYIPMPEVVSQVMGENNGRKKVLISVGSGGKKELFLTILRATLGFDCDFFISVVGILEEEEIKDFPSNYHFCEKFPLIEIAQQCDVAMIQGGQGTMYAVLTAQCPFVSMPATFEQKHNIRNLLNHYSCGEMLNSYDVNEENIKTALSKVLEDPSYKESALKVAEDIAYHTADRQHTPTVAADRIEEFLNKHG